MSSYPAMLLFSFPKIINQSHYNMFEGKKKCLFVRKYQIFNWVALYAGYTLESPIYSNYRTATLSGFYVPGFNIIKGPKYCQCQKQLMKQLH